MAAGEAALAFIAHTVAAAPQRHHFLETLIALELLEEQAVAFLGVLLVDLAPDDLPIKRRVHQDTEECDAVAAILRQTDFGFVLVWDEATRQQQQAENACGPGADRAL